MDDVTENGEIVETEAEVNPPPAERAPEPSSRFLFVDIAAMRAKQLRRGALPRLAQYRDSAARTAAPKLERIAMEEVAAGLVHYDVPPLEDWKSKGTV